MFDNLTGECHRRGKCGNTSAVRGCLTDVARNVITVLIQSTGLFDSFIILLNVP